MESNGDDFELHARAAFEGILKSNIFESGIYINQALTIKLMILSKQ